MARAITFDTLQYAKKAREVGFTEQQAEFQAEEIARVVEEQNDRLATKDDLDKTIKALEERLAFRMEALSSKLVVRLGGIVAVLIGVATTILAIVIKL